MEIDDDLRKWINAVAPILKAVREGAGSDHTGLEMIAKEFRIPGDTTAYLKSLAVLYDRLNAPNDKEYVLLPKREGATSLAEIKNIISDGEIGESLSKSIYMMTRLTDKGDWKDLIEEIDSVIFTHSPSKPGVGPVVISSKLEEYAGGVGSLIVIGSRQNMPEAREKLSSRRDHLYVALGDSENKPATTSAFTVALLYAENRPIQSTSEESIESPDVVSSKDGSSNIQKGRDRLNNIIEKPLRHQEICHKINELLGRAGLELDDLSDENSNRDLEPLREHISRLKEKG